MTTLLVSELHVASGWSVAHAGQLMSALARDTIKGSVRWEKSKGAYSCGDNEHLFTLTQAGTLISFAYQDRGSSVLVIDTNSDHLAGYAQGLFDRAARQRIKAPPSVEYVKVLAEIATASSPVA